jgi:hypothetical protein
MMDNRNTNNKPTYLGWVIGLLIIIAILCAILYYPKMTSTTTKATPRIVATPTRGTTIAAPVIAHTPTNR